MVECPNCDTEMESKGATGRQTNGIGAPVAVDVAWEECPDCGYVIDDSNNHHPPDE